MQAFFINNGNGKWLTLEKFRRYLLYMITRTLSHPIPAVKDCLLFGSADVFIGILKEELREVGRFVGLDRSDKSV